jgi:hypothetical protein
LSPVHEMTRAHANENKTSNVFSVLTNALLRMHPHAHMLEGFSFFFPPRFKKRVITRKKFGTTHTTHNNLCRMNVNITVLHHHFHFRVHQKPQQNFTIIVITRTCTCTEIYPRPLQSSNYTLREYRIAH